jgi:hypothetical protein
VPRPRGSTAATPGVPLLPGSRLVQQEALLPRQRRTTAQGRISWALPRPTCCSSCRVGWVGRPLSNLGPTAACTGRRTTCCRMASRMVDSSRGRSPPLGLLGAALGGQLRSLQAPQASWRP